MKENRLICVSECRSYRHHKVSSSITIKVHHNTHNSVSFEVLNVKMPNNSVKYKVFVKQYLRAILDLLKGGGGGGGRGEAWAGA